MNTPAHLIFGLAVFGKPDAGKVTAAALAGALIPDVSLYVMAGTHLLVLGTDPQVVFGQLYFSEAWQSIFRVDNSIVLWGIAVSFAIWARSAWGVALCGAALLHLGLDFLVHVDDGRQHFWPLSTWIFESPVSYWDPNHHGRIVGAIEALTSAVLSVWLWRRFKTRLMRATIGALALIEVLPSIMFAVISGGN